MMYFVCMNKKRTNIYLSDEDKRDIALIQHYYGHEDMASAVRFAIRKVAREIQEHVLREKDVPGQQRTTE